MWLIYLGLTGGLGANPFDKIIKFTGDWTIRFLLITLAITPLRRLTGINSLIRFPQNDRPLCVSFRPSPTFPLSSWTRNSFGMRF
jgi:hypothetical protein